MRRLALGLMRGALRLLLLAAPVRRRALVFGMPDSDDNALLLAVALAARYDGDVVLWCVDPGATATHLARIGDLLELDPQKVIVQRRSNTVGRVWTFLTAELVLYTHGLMGSPVPPRRKVHVNLWHGVGPKRSANARTRQRVGARFLVSCTEAWGRETMRSLRMPDDAAMLPGLPRQDLLRQGLTMEQRQALGLPLGRPWVLWMPTYRVLGSSRGPIVVDGPPLGPTFATALQEVVEAARRAEVDLVMKAHPFGLDAWRPRGVRVLTDADIAEAGASLYQVVGEASGLISDYSSAWVDFLATRRPVALVCPDLEEYRRRRGLKEPELIQVAAGLVVETARDAARFFEEVQVPGSRTAEVQDSCRGLLGYTDIADRTAALTEALLVEVARSRLLGGSWRRAGGQR